MSGFTNVSMALRVGRSSTPVPPAVFPTIVAVAEDGTDRVLRSTDGGVTFELVNVTTRQWTALAWAPTLGSGQGRLVAVARNTASANNVMYSDDLGATWTMSSFPANFTARGAAWSPTLGLFVATGVVTLNQVMSSSDGITWTERTASAGGAIGGGVRWWPSAALFVFPNSASRLWRSANGINWTNGPFPSGFTSNGIYKQCIAGARLLDGFGSDELMYTTNPAVAFTTINNVLPGSSLNNMAFSPTLGTGNGRIVAAAEAGAGSRIGYSDDLGATAFTASTGYSSRVWRAITRSDELGLFLAISNGATNPAKVAKSSDGISFTEVDISNQTWTDIIVCDGLAV